MSDFKNLEEHNKAKLNLISQKLNVIENNLEKDINLLQTKIDTFIDDHLEETINELSLLKVNVEVPTSNITKNSLDDILEHEEFTPNKIIKTGSIVKNFFISMFLGIFISGSVLVYQLFSLGLLSSDIINSFSLANIMSSLNNVSTIIPGVDIPGNLILGILSGLIFIASFVLFEVIRKKKLSRNASLIEKELSDYEKEIDLKAYTYSDIDEFIINVDKQIDTLIVLLDEENSKLKRINFMKDKFERPDLKTIKDISRVQNLIEKINELLSIEILDEHNEVSLKAKDILNDSTEYINKHIKKIYKEED